MSPAFDQWLELLFMKRLRRPSWLRAMSEEWIVREESPHSWTACETDVALRAMGSFQCVRCSLWQYVDRPPSLVVFRREGRACLRCSEVPMTNPRRNP